MADAHISMASIHAWYSDRRAARASYEQALAILNYEATAQTADAHCGMARLALEEGRAAAALRLASKALDTALQARSRIDEGRASLTLGQVLVGLDRRDRAVPHLQNAVAIFTDGGVRQLRVVADDMLRYAAGEA